MSLQEREIIVTVAVTLLAITLLYVLLPYGTWAFLYVTFVLSALLGVLVFAASQTKEKVQAKSRKELPPVRYVQHAQRLTWHYLRCVFQIISLMAFLAIPILGVIRLDITNRSLQILGRKLWLGETISFYLLLIAFLVLLLGSASVFGRAFCSWACPRGTLMEAAFRFILKVQESGKLIRWLRYILLALTLLITSAALAFAQVSFFAPPSFIIERLQNGDFSHILVRGFAVLTIAILLDLTLLRQRYCLYLCPVGYILRLLWDENALRVTFDIQRSSECLNCLRCVQTCFMRLDPRKKELQTDCVNCTLCSVACEVKGLLSYRYVKGFPLKRFAFLTGSFILLSTIALAVFLSAPPYDLHVSRFVQQRHRNGNWNFLITLYNRTNKPVKFSLKAEVKDGIVANFEPAIVQIPKQGFAKSNLSIEVAGSSTTGIVPVKIVAEGDGHFLSREVRVYVSRSKINGKEMNKDVGMVDGH